MRLTPLSRRRPEIYSDFPKDLTLSLTNYDVSRNLDEASINDAIKNLVLTDRGERLFQPEIGCDIRKMLFENITPDVIITAKQIITNVIESYEPRCNLIGVDVLASLDNNAIQIIITYNIINRQDPITFTLTLDRVR